MAVSLLLLPLLPVGVETKLCALQLLAGAVDEFNDERPVAAEEVDEDEMGDAAEELGDEPAEW